MHPKQCYLKYLINIELIRHILNKNILLTNSFIEDKCCLILFLEMRVQKTILTQQKSIHQALGDDFHFEVAFSDDCFNLFIIADKLLL